MRYMIKEVHKRLCVSHIGGRALASKIAKAGYYWPTLKGDCMDYVRRCNKCQRFAEVVDYFTKWIETELVATISVERIKCFYWKKILRRFGLPTEIVSNNRTHFVSRATIDFYTQPKIKQHFTSVEHPQTNGQAEAANKVILRGLCRRLEEAKGR
ncbi:hypothetical protein CR513_16430, partial [Mucuna pruriens]